MDAFGAHFNSLRVSEQEREPDSWVTFPISHTGEWYSYQSQPEHHTHQAPNQLQLSDNAVTPTTPGTHWPTPRDSDTISEESNATRLEWQRRQGNASRAERRAEFSGVRPLVNAPKDPKDPQLNRYTRQPRVPGWNTGDVPGQPSAQSLPSASTRLPEFEKGRQRKEEAQKALLEQFGVMEQMPSFDFPSAAGAFEPYAPGTRDVEMVEDATLKSAVEETQVSLAQMLDSGEQSRIYISRPPPALSPFRPPPLNLSTAGRSKSESTSPQRQGLSASRSRGLRGTRGRGGGRGRGRGGGRGRGRGRGEREEINKPALEPKFDDESWVSFGGEAGTRGTGGKKLEEDEEEGYYTMGVYATNDQEEYGGW